MRLSFLGPEGPLKSFAGENFLALFGRRINAFALFGGKTKMGPKPFRFPRGSVCLCYSTTLKVSSIALLYLLIM